MPHREFLEKFPLYRPFEFDVPGSTDELVKTPIKMECPTCTSEQTFAMVNEYWETLDYSNSPTADLIVKPTYVCTSCQSFTRVFLVKFDAQNTSMMKVGQFPPWDIAGNPHIERLLGEHSGYFRRGLISESQGYGIGSFAYYRRIVEEIIDELLDQIGQLMSGEEKTRYEEALVQAKGTRVASDKIDIVKDLLPPILRPGGVNPLATLHSVLSEGLHAESDERCLELAMAVREVLAFMASQVAASHSAAQTFTENMKKLLDRKRDGAA